MEEAKQGVEVAKKAIFSQTYNKYESSDIREIKREL